MTKNKIKLFSTKSKTFFSKNNNTFKRVKIVSKSCKKLVLLIPGEKKMPGNGNSFPGMKISGIPDSRGGGIRQTGISEVYLFIIRNFFPKLTAVEKT